MLFGVDVFHVVIFRCKAWPVRARPPLTCCLSLLFVKGCQLEESKPKGRGTGAYLFKLRTKIIHI